MFIENCLVTSYLDITCFFPHSGILNFACYMDSCEMQLEKHDNNFRAILHTQFIFIIHSVLCSQDLKVKAAEQKSLIDFIESCVEKMQPQFEDSVKSEPRYKATKSLPRFSYVQLPKPTETLQEHCLEQCVPVEGKLQELGDFYCQQSGEIEFHLCDSFLDTGLTGLHGVSLDIRQD